MIIKSPINQRLSGGGDQDDGSLYFRYWRFVRGGSWNRKLRILGVMLMIFQISFLLQLVSQQALFLSRIMDDEDINMLTIPRNNNNEKIIQTAIQERRLLASLKRSQSLTSIATALSNEEEEELVGTTTQEENNDDDDDNDDDYDDVVNFDNDVLQNIRATYDGARSHLKWPFDTKEEEQSLSLDSTFKVLPLLATVDRRPIIVRKQIIDSKQPNKRLLLGCALSSTTFVSDLEFQDVKSQSYEDYEHRCEICFQFSNRDDMLNFGPTDIGVDKVNVQGSTATKCFIGEYAKLSATHAKWQQLDERFIGYGFPWTIDCQMPNGIPELTCHEITKLQNSIDGRDDIQSIYYKTSFMLDGYFSTNTSRQIHSSYLKKKFEIHSRWPWKAVMSHDDDRSKIAKRLSSSKYIPNTYQDLKLAHVQGPIYEFTQDNTSSLASLVSTTLNPMSRAGLHYRLLVNLFHLLRNAPGSTHMIAVVDGQVKQTYENLCKLLDTPINKLYPKYSSIFNLNRLVAGSKTIPGGEKTTMIRKTQHDDLIPVTRMVIGESSYEYCNMTLMELLRERQIKINVIPILIPSMAFQKSVCGGQYLFTTYLAARYAADYHSIMYVDGDAALIEHSSAKKTLQHILYDRFFLPRNSTICAGHRIRLIEQYVEPQYDDDTEKVLQCTANLSTNPTKWSYAVRNCQLKEGHIVARTDSIYAFSVHHPHTLPRYLPPGVEDCIAPDGDRYFLKENEVVEIHLRNRKRKTGCSCFYEPKATSAYTSLFDDDGSFFNNIHVGSLVSYYYDGTWGWLLAKIINIQRHTGELQLKFLVDDETMKIDYNTNRLQSLDSMNTKQTGAWMNCTVSTSQQIRLRPNNDTTQTPSTATVSCHTTHYIASKDSFKRSGKIITGVLSGAKNFDRRQVIRSTWAKNRPGVFFVVAGNWSGVAEEYQKYQDLIWIDERETFQLLTLKTSLFLQVVDDMAKELKLKYSHVLKTDDDSYVALERIQTFLESDEARSGYNYWGYCEQRYWQPKREPDHLYYMSFNEYPKPYYPPYCQGAGFLLSRKFVHCASSEGHINNARFVSMEDVFVGLLAARCKVRPTHDIRFQPFRVKSMRAIDSRRVTADSKLLPKATMDGKFLQHQIKGIDDMIAHHESATGQEHRLSFSEGVASDIVAYFNKNFGIGGLAKPTSREQNGNAQLSIDIRIGEIVAYFYDDFFGWLLAKVLDIQHDGKLQLLFLLDGESETVDFYAERFKSFESMNSNETGAFANCTATENRMPGNTRVRTYTAIISCRNIDYFVSKEAFKRSGKIIAGVLSDAKNFNRRQVIRETWANNRTGVFFIVAGPWIDVAKEYEKYKDLIWMDEEEAFDLLTLKTSLFIQVVHDMASALNLDYSHILKTDDDSYVALGRLQDYIQRRETSENTVDYWGQCKPRYLKPMRDPSNIYHVGYAEYPESFYPPFCQGAGFLLSTKFVNCAGQGHIKNARFLSMEDVFVGILAARCRVWPTHDKNNLVKVYRVEGSTVFNRRVPNEIELPNATMDGKVIQHQINNDKDMLDHHASFESRLKGTTKKRRLEFVHITKTGGSAVEKAAAIQGVMWGACHYLNQSYIGCASPDIPYSDPGFQSFEQSSPWHTPPKLVDGYSPYYGADLFTIVRNPYARAVSEYYCPWLGFRAKYSEVRLEGDRNDPSVMNAWIQNMVVNLENNLATFRGDKVRFAATPTNPDSKFLAQKHYINQAEYVYDGETKVIKNILFYENLKVDFDDLMEQYDLKIRLPLKAKNGTNTAEERQLSYLDLWPETIGMINNFAAADFKAFGYEMVEVFQEGVAYSLKPGK